MNNLFRVKIDGHPSKNTRFNSLKKGNSIMNRNLQIMIGYFRIYKGFSKKITSE